MARVAIVSYDVQTIFGKSGGVGAFTTRWAELLRDVGEEVTIVMTRIDWEPMRVDVEWRARYQARGIGLIELQAPPPLTTRWPEVPTMRMSEIAAPVLKGFDIVYFQDWGNAAFHLVRERLCSIEQGPICVTVLHGPSEWETMSNEKYPSLPGDLHLNYQERYAARHSDFVVSPSRYMARHLLERGWQFPGLVRVLGLPMPVQPAKLEVLDVKVEIQKIVYFGRVEERKGIRMFVQALRLVVAKRELRPEIVLLGGAPDEELLAFALEGIRSAGYKVSHLATLNSEEACRYLTRQATETLCVVPSKCDNHPYSIVEASLIPGLNMIACRGGGVPEILQNAQGVGAERQLCEPFAQDLAAAIQERILSPLSAGELAQYDCSIANERWLDFHREALESNRARKAKVLPKRRESVDVCTTYYQKARYLLQLMTALERQSESDFHVIAVNDGSPDEESNRVFTECAALGQARGWDFYRQENAFVDAARNSAMRRGSGDLILFVDSDDVPALHAVARMREAMSLSQADALICGSFLFASDQLPYDPRTGELKAPAYAICVPLGMDLAGGLLNPSAFGGSMFIVRRTVFEAVGGFREMRGAGHEDWELYVRLALGGYKVEVLPELLHFYRQVDGSLARTLSDEKAKRRLVGAYEESLSAAGLGGTALALFGLHQRTKEMERRIETLSAKREPRTGHYSFFSKTAGRFESEEKGPNLTVLQDWYRRTVSLEMRLKIHRLLLAPFVGPYRPQSP